MKSLGSAMLSILVSWWFLFDVASAAGGEILDRALAGPLRGTDFLLFTVAEPHGDLFDPTGERVNGEAAAVGGRARGLPGELVPARLCRLDLRTGQRDVLFEADPGDIGGGDVHPDGRRVVLSLRSGGPEAPYHLVELVLDSPFSNEPARSVSLRQITDGPEDDIDPIWMPDGSIVFSSTRSTGSDPRNGARQWTLHRRVMDKSIIEPCGDHAGWQRQPVALAEGRIGFVGWDNLARPLLFTSHVSTVAPDDTQDPLVHWWGDIQGLTLFQVRRFPDERQLVGIVTPGGALTREKGWLAFLDLRGGAGEPAGLRILGLDPGWIEARRWDRSWVRGAARPIHVEHPQFRWRYPYPLGNGLILATTDRTIEMIDVEGRSERVFEEGELDGELGWVQPVKSAVVIEVGQGDRGQGEPGKT